MSAPAWSLGPREEDLAARFPRVIGRSERTAELRRQLAAAAGCEATVLLRGESGTGKEVAAWSIHEASERRRGPMVVVDCSAIASELIESELFGHERGAFTGALGPRAGLFEVASGGTIFLDEIGELPLAMQPKLLRVLESRTVRRVGGQKNVAVDVRVVCATHRDLRAEVRAGRFREDLYFRLAVLCVELPALRARRDDVPLLVEHFLHQQSCKQQSASAAAVMARIARERRHELVQHDWPGNVRELRNHVERCAAFGRWVPLDGNPEPELAREEPSGEHRVAAILGVDGSKAYADEKQKWVSLFERAYLEELLRVHDDNVKAAARTAGIDRAYLYRLLYRHGLR
ncbi:sigma-54 interaction domain-containing protein [Sandaracinus amylolyticus]|uniref:sigma-54 interaction domain-containing protein n=1 Tax=Sandaracinus amylolyticus TaxID=927083 RepID=UPI001F1BE4FC|nr:sigma-54 dependent transcriptional regulator [Sandaracinus amylolyticus]UJR85782.1 Hypothetical protein I5071_78620 [Sandaracinus amylolyticus]